MRVGGETWGRAVGLLADGSCLVAGSFQGQAALGLGEPGATTLTAAPGGQRDGFIARFGADGSLVWAKRFGGADDDVALGMATFPDGSAVVTGSFAGSAEFGAGEPAGVTLTATGAPDAFVARFSASGTLAWARRAGGTDETVGLAVAAVAGGACLATGTFRGSATFGPGEPGATTLTSLVGSGFSFPDMFVARLGADGALAWVKQVTGTREENPYGIVALADGSSVVTGGFATQGVARFGPGEANETTLGGIGASVQEQGFFARYDADGTLSFARRVSTSTTSSRGVAAGRDGSILLTGSFVGTQDPMTGVIAATFGEGEPNETKIIRSTVVSDVFVARYAASGLLIRASAAGGGSEDEGLGIAGLPDGSPIVTGFFSGTATFGEGDANATRFIGSPSGEMFLARFNTDGGF